MPDVTLQVPLVGQKTGYDGKPLLQANDQNQMVQHGFMACWYAAACMLSYYYRPGPRLGIPTVWRADAGLTLAAIDTLARTEGLKVVPKPLTGLTSDALAGLLRAHGPIWAAGYYLDGYPTAGTRSR